MGVRSEMRSDGGFVKQESHFCAEASKLREKEREIENENAKVPLLGGILLIRHVSWLWYLTSLYLIHLTEKCVNLP